MARSPLTFRRRDVTAAVKAVEAAGHIVDRVEIGRDGRIIVIPVKRGQTVPEPDGEEHWDAPETR